MDVPDDESNEFDITNLWGVSKAEFNEQTIAHVFYELEGAASKLGELGIYFKQCTSLKQPQDIQHTTIFHETLTALQAELSCLVNPSSKSASGLNQPPPSTPTTPPPCIILPPLSQNYGHKCTVLDIIGASPAKASKWKQSHKPFWPYLRTLHDVALTQWYQTFSKLCYSKCGIAVLLYTYTRMTCVSGPLLCMTGVLVPFLAMR